MPCCCSSPTSCRWSSRAPSLFAALGYASEAEQQARRVGAERKSFLTLGILLALVLVPLAANTALVVVLHGLSTRIESVAETWLAGSPQAEVTDVEYTASAFRVDVRTPPGQLPPTQQLLGALEGQVPDGLRIVVDTTYGEEIDAGSTGSG